MGAPGAEPRAAPTSPGALGPLAGSGVSSSWPAAVPGQAPLRARLRAVPVPAARADGALVLLLCPARRPSPPHSTHAAPACQNSLTGSWLASPEPNVPGAVFHRWPPPAARPPRPPGSRAVTEAAVPRLAGTLTGAGCSPVTLLPPRQGAPPQEAPLAVCMGSRLTPSVGSTGVPSTPALHKARGEDGGSLGIQLEKEGFYLFCQISPQGRACRVPQHTVNSEPY